MSLLTANKQSKTVSEPRIICNAEGNEKTIASTSRSYERRE